MIGDMEQRRRSFCYCVRDANNGDKLVGGTVSADSMDEAALILLKREKLETVTKESTYWTDYYYYNKNGRKVNLYISASPEYMMKLEKSKEKEKNGN